MNYPIPKLASTGADLVSLASQIRTLATEASGINASIAGCYGQGGVGGRADGVSSKMYNQANTVAHLGQVSSAAAKEYMITEDSLCTTVYSRSGEAYVRVVDKQEKQNDSFINGPYGKVVQKGIDKVKGIVANIKDVYNQHGTLYDVVEYGKCALRVGKGIVKIFGAVGEIASGVGIPIGIASIISAGNDMINAANDAAYIYTDQYDKVGSTNILKDTLVSGYGDLGEMLGNREAGEMFGKLTYNGLDMVSFLDGADDMLKSYGKVNTEIYGPKNSFVWGEAHWDDIFDSEYEHLDLPSFLTNTNTFGDELIRKNILHIHSGSTAHFIIEAVKDTVSVFKKGSSFAENTLDTILG